MARDDASEGAVALVERLFAILRDCRAVVRELEPGQPRHESPSAEAERLLYYALVGAMRQAQQPLGPMGEEWLKRRERDV